MNFDKTTQVNFSMKCLETLLRFKKSIDYNSHIIAVATKQDDMLFQTAKYITCMILQGNQSELIPIAMELLNNPLFKDIVLWETIIQILCGQTNKKKYKKNEQFYVQWVKTKQTTNNQNTKTN